MAAQPLCLKIRHTPILRNFVSNFGGIPILSGPGLGWKSTTLRQQGKNGGTETPRQLGLSPETSKGHLKIPYKYGDNPNKSWIYPNTVSFGGIPNSRNVLFLQIFPAPNSPRPSPEPSLWNPVEPDLALHQSLPDFLRNPLRSAPKSPTPGCVELDVALHPSLPDLLWNLVDPDPASAPKPPGTFSGTFPGTPLNLTRRLQRAEDPISLCCCWGKKTQLLSPTA